MIQFSSGIRATARPYIHKPLQTWQEARAGFAADGIDRPHLFGIHLHAPYRKRRGRSYDEGIACNFLFMDINVGTRRGAYAQ
ncbi:MAG: hypothetical protein K2J27_00450 [Duncaniella sp.]|nr:hypothetical protein [Duncaniella sp.]